MDGLLSPERSLTKICMVNASSGDADRDDCVDETILIVLVLISKVETVEVDVLEGPKSVLCQFR